MRMSPASRVMRGDSTADRAIVRPVIPTYRPVSCVCQLDMRTLNLLMTQRANIRAMGRGT